MCPLADSADSFVLVLPAWETQNSVTTTLPHALPDVLPDPLADRS